MVSIQSDRRPSKQSSVSPYFLVVLVLVFTVLFTFTSSNEIFALNPSVSRENTAIQDALSLDLEAQTMRTWRQQLETSCQQFLRSIPSNNISQAHLVHKALLESQALQRMVIPDLETSVHKTKTKPDYKFCSHVFLDLGTNRGDSISCAIDASLDVCSAHFVEKDPTIRPAYRLSLDFPRFHFNSTDLRVHASGSQGLSLLRLLQHFFERPGMESVCVYGIEGNPYFTKKLQAMVQVINAIRPRPLKYLHIDTETVVHSVDGPTALYIDQFSEKNHVSDKALTLYSNENCKYKR